MGITATQSLIGLSRTGKIARFRHLIERPVGISCNKSNLHDRRLQAFGPQLTSSTVQQLQEDADRQGDSMMWIVVEEHGYFLAVSVTEDGVGSGWLAGDSLTELRQHLPLGLVRSDVQPSETPSIIEIWCPA